MPAAKRLLTGPHGAALRDRLLEQGGESGLWLVPTPLARVQVSAALGRKLGAEGASRVWCWDDLWRAVREGRDDGPVKLSDAAAHAALGLAIERAKAAGALGTT